MIENYAERWMGSEPGAGPCRCRGKCDMVSTAEGFTSWASQPSHKACLSRRLSPGWGGQALCSQVRSGTLKVTVLRRSCAWLTYTMCFTCPSNACQNMKPDKSWELLTTNELIMGSIRCKGNANCLKSYVVNPEMLTGLSARSGTGWLAIISSHLAPQTIFKADDLVNYRDVLQG